MSKTTPVQRRAASIWLSVLSDHDEYFRKPWEMFLLRKLKEARFTKEGRLRLDAVGNMIVQEQPTLYKFWKERMNAKNNA